MKKLNIFGYIVSEKWEFEEFSFDLKDLTDFLNTLKPGEEFEVDINSGGGSVFIGNTIYNKLVEMNPRPVVNIIGEASSIASIIAMAGSKVRIAENAVMLLHKPSILFTGGNSDELKKDADNLDTIESAMIKTYASKTGLDKQVIADILQQDRYHDAQQLKEWGFVDEVYSPTKEVVNLTYKYAASANKHFESKKLDRKFNLDIYNNNSKGTSMDFEKEFKALKVDFDKLQSSQNVFSDTIAEQKGTIKELQAKADSQIKEITALKEEKSTLENSNKELSAKVAEMETEKIEAEVDLFITANASKILPVERDTLKSELLAIRNANLTVNDKSLYEMKCEQIKARKDFDGLNDVSKAELTDNTKLSDKEMEAKADEIAAKEGISFKQAYRQLMETK